jgi:hypothetical protein
VIDAKNQSCKAAAVRHAVIVGTGSALAGRGVWRRRGCKVATIASRQSDRANRIALIGSR